MACGESCTNRVDGLEVHDLNWVQRKPSSTFVNSPPWGLDESRTRKVTKVVARRPEGPIEAPETSAGGPGARSGVCGSAWRVARDA